MSHGSPQLDPGHRSHARQSSWSYDDRAAESDRWLVSRCFSFATAGSAETSSLAVARGCHGRLAGQVASLTAVHSSIQVIALTLVSRAGRTTIVPQRALGGSRVVAPRSPRLALLSRAARLWPTGGMNDCAAKRLLSQPSTASSTPLLPRSSAELLVRRSCHEGRSVARDSCLPARQGWLC